MRTLSRSAGRLLLVWLAAAVVLRGLDAVPAALTGLPRGTVAVASLDELRRMGGDMPEPSYVPAGLDWPPPTFTLYRGREAAATWYHRESRAPWLIVATTRVPAGGFDAAVIPSVTTLQAIDVPVAGSPARVERVQDRTGVIWHQAVWQRDGRTVLARYRGSLSELLRIAVGLQPRSSR